MTTPVLAHRLTRDYRQTLHASPERVFPLLCPVREKEWLPDWDARMIYSASGVAEPGAVFVTQFDDEPEVTWIVAEHRPPARVHFARWHPGEMIVDLQLDLSESRPDTTWLDIRYIYTALSCAGATRIAAMTEEQWHGQMTFWESSLNQWLASHPA